MSLNNSHFINGKWVPSTGQNFSSIDPSNEQIIWKGSTATPNEVNGAFEAAKKALKNWSGLPLKERIKYLENFRTVLSRNEDVLSKTISQETGKPLWDSKGEVAGMINKIALSIEAYAVRCAELHGKHPYGALITRHRPHGVMAVLGPFNFPGHLPNGHIIPSLLSGNTIVFKPSELTPLVAQKTIECWEESNIPAGVINMVQGGRETGKLVLENPLIDGLLFTGSWQTGRYLADHFSIHPQKILALEMGGNNPFVIGSISDVKTAAYITIQSAFISSGQRCTCARRLIVPTGKVGDAFIKELIRMTKSIVIGAYNDDPEPFMGPVISNIAADALLKKQEELLSLGGKPLILMSRLSRGPMFLSPGIVDVTSISNKPDEEIFGPLLQLIRVKDINEAISEANNTAYGLVAGLLSDKAEEYESFYKEVSAGVINWNAPLTGASSAAPFGGIGKSGNNRPSAFYAADYCAYPVASIESSILSMPKSTTPGVTIDGDV